MGRDTFFRLSRTPIFGGGVGGGGIFHRNQDHISLEGGLPFNLLFSTLPRLGQIILVGNHINVCGGGQGRQLLYPVTDNLLSLSIRIKTEGCHMAVY